MKLTTFTIDETQHFGFKHGTHLVPFSGFSKLKIPNFELLDSMKSYLSDLDKSFPAAKAVADHVETNSDALIAGKTSFEIEDGVLDLPVNPYMFYDMLTSPTHVYLSSKTMLDYELKGLVKAIVGPILLRGKKKDSENLAMPDVPEYYKGNIASFTKSGDPLQWPVFTSFLDIEPELAFVTGRSKTNPIAGYLIINDCSARDIQMPEMSGTRLGPQRSKDFQNVMSSYLVTPDEVDPFDCRVDVKIGDRYHWTGHSDKYVLPPMDAVQFMERTCPLQPGTLIALGTIPACDCLDNDLWIRPGDKIRIEFEGIGVMENTVAAPEYLDRKQACRWRERDSLKSYYRG